MEVTMNRLICFRGRRFVKVALALCTTTALLPCALMAKKFAMKSASIVPAASGEVKTSKDKNGNTIFVLEVKNLAKPGALTPPRTTYMVWIQPKGGAPESQGILKVNDKLEGRFQSSTQDNDFDLWITAENDDMAKSPSGAEVLRANGVGR
jgi:hypothetical protein